MRQKRLPRPRLSTCLVACAALCFFAIFTVPGELLSPIHDNFSGGYTAVYEHGWPFVWMRRRYFYDFSPSKMFPDIPVGGVPWLAADSWRVWEADTAEVFLPAMLADAAVVVACVGILIGFWEWRRRQRLTPLRFNLRDLLAGATLLAVVGGWWASWRNGAIAETKCLKASSEIAPLFEETDYYGPLWLRRLAGKDNLGLTFDRVHAITLEEIDRQKLDELVPHLERLSQLVCVRIVQGGGSGKSIRTDNVPRFSELARLKRLRFLVLSRRLGKTAVSELGELTGIEEIAISGPAWDQTLPLLSIRVQGTLPNCRVVEDSTYRSPADRLEFW